MPDLLTVAEAAAYLRLTPGAIYSQRHRGELPGQLGAHIGRKVLFSKADLDRYIDECLAARSVTQR